MSGGVDIDAAFETVIAREQATVNSILSQVAPVRPLLRTLSQLPFFAAFGGAISARQELLATCSEWAQYAVDEAVISSFANKVGVVFGAYVHSRGVRTPRASQRGALAGMHSV